MNKVFEEPNIDVVEISVEDIMTTSSGTVVDPGDNGTPFG